MPPHSDRLRRGTATTTTNTSTSAAPRRVFAQGSYLPRHETTTATTTTAKTATTQHSASSSFVRTCRLHYDFVDSALKAKADTLDRCTYVVAYLLFVVGFCFYFLYNVDPLGRYQLWNSLLGTLSKAEMPRLKSAMHFKDVASATDYADYITYAVAPLLANVLSPTGSSIPLGGLRVRTQRSITIGCEDSQGNRATSLYTTIACADSSVSSQEDTHAAGRTRFDLETLWSYKSCRALGGSRLSHIRGVLGVYHCGGFMFQAPLWVKRRTEGNSSDTSSLAPSLGTPEQAFPFTEGTLAYQPVSLYTLQQQYLHHLFWEASTPFVDNYATRMVVAEVLFYHPALHLFATVKLMGEVTNSGSWVTTAAFHTTRVWTAEDMGKGIYDTVVMLFVLLWCVWFASQAVLFVRQRVRERRCDGDAEGAERARDSSGLSYSSVSTVRVMAIAEFFFSAENLHTLAVLCMLVATSAFRIAAMVYCAQSIPRLEEIIYKNVYPTQFEYLFFLNMAQLYLNGVIVLLLFYRGLCFVTVGTHAARLMRLLSRAQATLCGYLLLSLLCTATFAVTLSSLYGQAVWAFRSVDSAFYTLIQILVRQHDISELTRNVENPLVLAFLLFSYFYVGAAITLSLASGIMVHGFHEVRKEESRPVSAAYQIRWLMRRVRMCVLTPWRWHSDVWRWCAGRGDAALLRHAARCLRAYRRAKYPALDHVEGELRQLVHLDDFIEAMETFHEAVGPSWFSDAHTAANTSAHRRRSSGVWMTWTTQSTSDASASGVVSGTVSLQSQALLTSSGSGGTSLTWAKSRAREGEREVLRRRWRERWGMYTPAQLWRDVAEDWLASTTSEAALHYREEVVWLCNGVQSVVGDNLSHAKAFPRRLAELERKLKLLESHFRENELTAAATEKADREERGEGDG